jgi:hypothetical protein
MARLESKQTRTQGASVTTVEFEATWQRMSEGSAGAVTKDPEPEQDKTNVQTISDPCDDNYVGPDDCLDPCNSNYMGEEACSEGSGDAAGDAAAKCTADAECGPDEQCSEGACVPKT